MSYSSSTTLDDASAKFPMFELTYTEINYEGVLPIFIARVIGEEQALKENWESLVNYIAFNFQSQLIEDFSVWNVYVFFVTENKINRSLKYKIENDTFSSRKIVIEENASQEEIISQHITNVDVKFTIENPIVNTELDADPLLKKYISRSTSSKRLTEDHRNCLKSIIRNLKESLSDEI
jgi:hypothetical protein